ncbi:hypothetical protein SAMN05444000_11843 [Shimia gijangensis]|uniref:Uncharacterized protein n=1 Tax=Shimia gijangensis TaxID=1470563 RepID=A0A1M6PGZ2_9RHOB|nr:hypothetical protein [Shimia gijangensis]SHK07226.1 hypothetical protein SAMN05444000_11843 [Shimia gijangensis]
MTALQKYDRIEASGLWRPTSNEQRREVVVSIGDASLTISDMQDRALAHWSLPAVERVNPGKRPAIYSPDGDPEETLELPASESQMIDAIEKLRLAILKRRPRPGRLRLFSLTLSAVSVLALAVFWLPGALLTHTISVVPDVKRQEIGLALMTPMERLTGKPCADVLATPALNRLTQRLGSGELVVVRGGVRDTLSLPGGTILINRSILEDYEEPDVAAGYVIAQQLEATTNDPLRTMLEHLGFLASFRLLTTGHLNDDMLRAYAEDLVVLPHTTLDTNTLLAAFSAREVKTSPYAYALDPSGERTLELIEADPFVTSPKQVLTDGDWVALQGICGN